jgi:cytochrome c oxidase subunit 2
MSADFRPRRLAQAALTVALIGLAACTTNPNSVFHARTDFNRDVTWLFNLILWMGIVVFVLVEALLVYAIIRFRAKPGAPRPEQVHGNTKLEIMWTVIPAIVLAIISVPTVTTIFKTQRLEKADAVRIEVIGHQWWWEFHYPQYGFTTANEVYMPIGKTIDFALSTKDVLHAFWIPALAGKRDLVNNRINHIYFTADSTTEDIFNGFCAEYCGTSHANMRFKAFAVTQEQFDSWAAHQAKPAVYSAPPPPPPTPPRGRAAAVPPAQAAPAAQGYTGFAREKMHAYTIPNTPIPASIAFDDRLVGDAARGQAIISSQACIACHFIKGNPMMVGKVGPDLTHIGSRLTIGGGLFPNDTRHLGAWIKNAGAMKPGSKMNTMGKGQYDHITKSTLQFGLTDQQIADIVAYLQALK